MSCPGCRRRSRSAIHKRTQRDWRTLRQPLHLRYARDSVRIVQLSGVYRILATSPVSARYSAYGARTARSTLFVLRSDYTCTACWALMERSRVAI
jgi:hypothetical protein